MRLSLRARQVLALAFVVLLVVVASTVAHLSNVARVALGAAADEGELLARQVYHQSARVMAASPAASSALLQQDPGIRALLEGMIGYSHTVVYAAVVDPADRILVHSNPKLDGQILPPRESIERLRTRSTLANVASFFGQPEVYEAQVPMRLGETPFGTVRVGVSTSLLKQELTQAALYSMGVALVALGVAVAVGLVVGHLLLQSLRKIAQGMERLARGEYGATVELTRDDEGVGIAAQDLEKIFRLYYTTKSQGSGIGLSMVYRTVQMHDGRVDVESEVDRGTVMILTLPVAPGSVAM